MRPTRVDLGIALLLAAGTLAAFGPAFAADFIGMDDPYYVYKNRHVATGLTAENVHWSWTTFEQANWHPLTWLSLQVDASLSKTAQGQLDPHAFHRTNILFHAANAALLFFALLALTGCRWRSAMVAGLFAVHPLRVESVAWVSERKDVLSLFFGLLALWAYAGYARKRTAGRYLAVAGLLALSLLAKPTLVTLPCLFLVLDWWPLGRARTPADWRRLTVEKAPLLALSVASCVVTYLAQQSRGAVRPLETLSYGGRLANAVVAYVSYLGMTVCPVNLAPIYPYVEGGWPAWRVAGSAVVFAGLTVLAVRQRHRRPYLLVGWLWYLGTLVPMIGLVQVGDQAYADRYTYFPQIGLALAVVWAVMEAVPAAAARGTLAAAAVLLAGLAALTAHQAVYWKDDLTLWPHALEVTEQKSAQAYNSLGTAYETAGRGIDEVTGCYRSAVDVNPRYSPGQYNYGRALRKQKKDAAAIEHFREAIRTDPKLAEAYDDLAKALTVARSYVEAEEHYRAALTLKPESTLFHGDYARFLDLLGRDGEALEHYREAVRCDPGDAAAHGRLGGFLGRRGNLPQALEHFRLAAELQPRSPDVLRDLGIALEKTGRWDKAAVCYRRVVELAPKDVPGRLRLAGALVHAGDTAGAGEQYRQASRLDPGWPDEIVRGAWLRAASPNARERDADAAVWAAESACNVVRPPPAGYLDVLAAAYAEAGRFADAVAAAEKAAAAADTSGNPELARAVADRLALYRANQPFRGPAPAAPR
jgi:tetratricopeptide (TPR) repeat protein